MSLSNEDLGRSLRPTEAMAQVKARYWAQLSERPLVANAQHTLALVKQLTQSASVESWWRKPGFREWFLNERAVEEKLEWLSHIALAALEDILLNTDPKVQSARLNAAKLVADMTGRSKRSAEDDPETKKKRAIDAMSREELTKLLESQGIRVEHAVSLPADAK